MSTNRTENGRPAMIVMAMTMAMIMLVSPVMTGSDAAEDRLIHVSVYAGASVQYDDIATPVDSDSSYLTIDGPMAQYLKLKGTSLSGKVPDNLPSGDYDCIITAHGKTQYSITLRFHVSQNPSSYSASDLDLIPSIDKVGVSKIAGSAKNISLLMSTSKADSVVVDYNDGIITPHISVTDKDTISTHTYSSNDVYTIKITASNQYGADTLVLVYDSAEENTQAETTESKDSGVSTGVIIGIVVAAIIAVLAVLHFVLRVI